MVPLQAEQTALQLSAVEQELVSAEVRAVARLQIDPDAKQRYSEFVRVVEEGVVPGERLAQLATILEIGLQSGRVRRFYGPEGEQAISRLYQRTPQGAAAVKAASEVTKALRALQGQVIDDLQLSALGPGSYNLLIDTKECQLTLRFERGGVRIDALALGI